MTTYYCINRNLLAAGVLMSGLLGAVNAHATTVTFNADPVGCQPSPFISSDSPLVRFSEGGAGAVPFFGVNNPGLSSSGRYGTNSCGSGADEILMEFSVPVNSLSFLFSLGSPINGFEGWLRVFNGAALVTEVRVAEDGDGLLDQTIAYTGAPITSARFAIVAASSTSLGTFAEAIDTVVFTAAAVPEPIPLALITVALAALALTSRKGSMRAPQRG
jgi:hypothetical protein